MIEHFKEILGEERYNQILQEVEGKTCEELLDEIDTLQQENQKYKEVIDKAMKYIEKDYSYTKRHDIPLLTKDEQLAGKLLDILKEVE